ncbi:MAG: hypothetical protein ACI819_002889, partial [Neolewinella sp.]
MLLSLFVFSHQIVTLTEDTNYESNGLKIPYDAHATR